MSSYPELPAKDKRPTVDILHFDIETRSTIDLKKSGAHKYAHHPTTTALCMCYAVGDAGRVELWLPDQPPPSSFVTAAADPDCMLCGHNVAFDRAVYENVLVPRFGFPPVPRERFKCTAAIARSINLPGALHDVAGALDLPEEYRKDTEGARVMLRLAKPRKPRKGEDPNIIHFDDSPKLKERVYQYCRTDVASEREIHNQLRRHQLSEFEQQLYYIDQRINDRGFCVDLELAESCKIVAGLVAREIDGDLARITGGAVTTVGQVAKTLKWLNAAQGVALPKLDKATIELRLQGDLPEPARQVLQLRLSGAASAVKKAQSFIDRTDFDGRLRGALVLYGAHTGRWSSFGGVQIHNLKRFEADNIPALLDAVNSRDLARIKALHSRPLELLGNLNRSMIVAGPGKVLLGADLSGVESRVLAYLAGEDWKVEAHRNADRTGQFCDDVYVRLGCRMTGTPVSDVTGKKHPARVIGKTGDLACGFQGWEQAVERLAPGMFTQEQREQIARQWRNQHPRIVRFWRDLQRAMWDATASCKPVDCGPVTFTLKGLWLTVRLPSGRLLYYPHPTNSLADPTEPEIGFKTWLGNDWRAETTYGGKLAENITQAVARDLLAEAMVRLDRAGFELIMHVHDEVVIELDAGEDREAELLQIMRQSPAWAPDLPINAAAWSGLRFQ